MLGGLICDCGSSLPLIRQFFQANGVPNYMSAPIIRGKDKCIEEAERLGSSELASHIQACSAFIIVIGYDQPPSESTQIDWVDINNAKLPQTLEAKAIVERYAF